jgi:hypothetical protein
MGYFFHFHVFGVKMHSKLNSNSGLNPRLFQMYELICQKSAHSCAVSFLQMFIVLWMYNFGFAIDLERWPYTDFSKLFEETFFFFRRQKKSLGITSDKEMQ